MGVARFRKCVAFLYVDRLTTGPLFTRLIGTSRRRQMPGVRGSVLVQMCVFRCVHHRKAWVDAIPGVWRLPDRWMLQQWAGPPVRITSWPQMEAHEAVVYGLDTQGEHTCQSENAQVVAEGQTNSTPTLGRS